MAKKYIVRLTEAERTDLKGLIHKGKVAAHKRLHAESLLKAEINELGEKWLDSQISEAFGHNNCGLGNRCRGLDGLQKRLPNFLFNMAQPEYYHISQ